MKLLITVPPLRQLYRSAGPQIPLGITVFGPGDDSEVLGQWSSTEHDRVPLLLRAIHPHPQWSGVSPPKYRGRLLQSRRSKTVSWRLGSFEPRSAIGALRKEIPDSRV